MEATGSGARGAAIGRYEVLEQLGRGGMGVVYRARDAQSGQEVALKLLTSVDERSRRRQTLETQALARLRHQNLVTLLDAGEHRGRPWLAMELVRGQSLQDRLDRAGPLAPREAATLVRALAIGLTHAHREGVLHRDLKPSNVLLPEGGGEPKLTDFGLAGFTFDLGQSRLTATGTLLGSPGYWSPEQAAGTPDAVGPAVDVYGLGGLLYAALTGHPPIRGESLQEVLLATERATPAAPRRDATLDAIALRCLRKRPEERYASVDAVKRELDHYLLGRAPRRRGRWLLPLAGLALAAVAAVVLARAPAPTPPVEVPPPAPPPVERRGPPGAPAWFLALPDERRPRLPLPRGVQLGAAAGVYVSERDGSELVFVPAATFRMGPEESSGGFSHEVTLTRGYFVGRSEVTWGQYRAFCQATGRKAPSNAIDYQGHFEADDRHPVFNVSWDDARAYCEWGGARLPTEAEWEHAARGGDGRAYPWGDEPYGPTRSNLGNTGAGRDTDYRGPADGFPYTAPVGSFPAGASPFGALDLSGNVWEWCQDLYGPYPTRPAVDPTGAERGEQRVLRGGSWDNEALPAAYRFSSPPAHAYVAIGFRVARSED